MMAGPMLETFRPLVPTQVPTPASGRKFAAVQAAPTFGDAIEALLTILPETPPMRLELTVARPMPSAALRVLDKRGRALWATRWAAKPESRSAGSCGALAAITADKRIAATVTEAALKGLGDLVRELPVLNLRPHDHGCKPS